LAAVTPPIQDDANLEHPWWQGLLRPGPSLDLADEPPLTVDRQVEAAAPEHPGAIQSSPESFGGLGPTILRCQPRVSRFILKGKPSPGGIDFLREQGSELDQPSTEFDC